MYDFETQAFRQNAVPTVTQIAELIRFMQQLVSGVEAKIAERIPEVAGELSVWLSGFASLVARIQSTRVARFLSVPASAFLHAVLVKPGVERVLSTRQVLPEMMLSTLTELQTVDAQLKQALQSVNGAAKRNALIEQCFLAMLSLYLVNQMLSGEDSGQSFLALLSYLAGVVSGRSYHYGKQFIAAWRMENILDARVHALEQVFSHIQDHFSVEPYRQATLQASALVIRVTRKTKVLSRDELSNLVASVLDRYLGVIDTNNDGAVLVSAKPTVPVDEMGLYFDDLCHAWVEVKQARKQLEQLSFHAVSIREDVDGFPVLQAVLFTELSVDEFEDASLKTLGFDYRDLGVLVFECSESLESGKVDEIRRVLAQHSNQHQSRPFVDPGSPYQRGRVKRSGPKKHQDAGASHDVYAASTSDQPSTPVRQWTVEGHTVRSTDADVYRLQNTLAEAYILIQLREDACANEAVYLALVSAAQKVAGARQGRQGIKGHLFGERARRSDGSVARVKVKGAQGKGNLQLSVFSVPVGDDKPRLFRTGEVPTYDAHASYQYR